MVNIPQLAILPLRHCLNRCPHITSLQRCRDTRQVREILPVHTDLVTDRLLRFEVPFFGALASRFLDDE
jgi:hypothetical protein